MGRHSYWQFLFSMRAQIFFQVSNSLSPYAYTVSVLILSWVVEGWSTALLKYSQYDGNISKYKQESSYTEERYSSSMNMIIRLYTLLLRASSSIWSCADSRLLYLANHPIRHIFKKKDESRRLSFARSDLFSFIIPANVAFLTLYMQKGKKSSRK